MPSLSRKDCNWAHQRDALIRRRNGTVHFLHVDYMESLKCPATTNRRLCQLQIQPISSFDDQEVQLGID